MQETDCSDRNWAARHQLLTIADQTTSAEFGNWRPLVTSFGRPQLFDVGCFRWRDYQPHAAPSASYAEQMRREWIANCVSYQRLKQLECRSAVDDTTSSIKETASSSRWPSDIERHRQSIVSIYTDLKDQQFSNGSYNLSLRHAFCPLNRNIESFWTLHKADGQDDSELSVITN